MIIYTFNESLFSALSFTLLIVYITFIFKFLFTFKWDPSFKNYSN